MISLRKAVPIVFVGGILSIFGGLAVAYIQTRLTLTASACLFGGVLCLAVSLVSFPFNKILPNLRLRTCGLMFGYVLGLLIVLIGANSIGASNNRRFDLTAAGQHTLSAGTERFVKSLTHDVKITVFYVGLAPKYLEDLLDSYRRASLNRVTGEIVDPLVQIGYASQFGNVITGNEKKAFVECGQERVSIDFKETPLSEEMITNAIITAARPKRHVYFLTGHAEYNTTDDGPKGLRTFTGLLNANNCMTESLFLTKDREIPSDCDILIIPGPKNPISDDDIAKIQKYLKKGGRAFILVEAMPLGSRDKPLTDREKKENPALNDLLGEWGLVIGNDIVVDMENHVGGDVGCPATRNYPPHKDIVTNLDYTFYIRPRSITLKKDISKDIKVAPLVLTMSGKSSWAETDKNLRVQFDKDQDIAGPIILGAVVWEPKKDTMITDTRLIVFTDADFISNNFIGQYSNADLALNSVAWLTKLNQVINVVKKEIDVPRLDLTSKQKRGIVVILLAMPILIAAAGAIVWWRRGVS